MTKNIVSLTIAALVASALHAAGFVHAAPPVSTAKEEARTSIDVTEEQQSRIGLRTTPVQKKALKHTIRTVGIVSTDQRSEAHVHTKINGWIERIYADFIGKSVKKGQPLFDLYSPDLVSTQEEYIAARKQGAAGRDLAQAALQRLNLWSVPAHEIERLKSELKSRRAITFASPADGFVVNKTAIQGMYVTPDMELYYIADLSKVWLIVTLYEYDVAAIQVGDSATVQLPYDPKQVYQS